MKKLLKEYTEENNKYYVIKVFRLFLYGWVLMNTLILLPAAEHFWGVGSYIELMNLSNSNILEKALNLLHYPDITNYYWAFLVVQIGGAFLAMTNRFSFLGSILVFFATMNLDNRSYVTLDGGNNLMHILQLYACLLIPTLKKSSYLIPLGKTALLACQLQVVSVYLVAGILKVTGNVWPSGLALFYTLNVDSYSHPLLKNIINFSPIFSVLGSYMTLAFQLSFPYLVWFKQTRYIMTFVGSMIHLGIAFGMGLMSFGFAMTISYFCFYDNEKAKKFYKLLLGQDKLYVAYDSLCSNCMTFAKLVRRTNFSKNIVIDDSHAPKTKELKEISYEDRNRVMYLYNAGTGEVLSGFDAVYEIFKNSFVLKVFIPVLYVLKISKIGNKIYLRIAESKWRSSCQNGQCQLNF
tara:strand:- start:126966 stop:128186 length:1221 start_codon:yes stop_codon:yes gene_type:complete